MLTLITALLLSQVLIAAPVLEDVQFDKSPSNHDVSSPMGLPTKVHDEGTAVHNVPDVSTPMGIRMNHNEGE